MSEMNTSMRAAARVRRSQEQEDSDLPACRPSVTAPQARAVNGPGRQSSAVCKMDA